MSTSLGETLVKGMQLTKVAAPPRPAPLEESEQSKLAKFFDLINREEEAAASAFNEMLFSPTPDPVNQYIAGIRGEGKVETFDELISKMGWRPTTKEGKTVKFLLSLAPAVGFSPSSYLTLGGAPTAKFLGKAGPLVAMGMKAADIGAEFGKGTGLAARVIERAQKIADPKVGEVLNKVMKGEKITKAEEAAIGARTVLGLQALGLTGTSDVLKLTPRPAAVEFFEQSEKLGKWLDQAPVISPIIHGFGKAFDRWYELKKKFPEYFRLRKTRNQKLHYTGIQAFRRIQDYVKAVGNPGERKIVSYLMEEGPEANVVTNSYFKDVTKLIERTPEIWADLGYKPGQRLSEEQSVELVNHWLTQVNQWIEEFGPEGLFSVEKAKMGLEAAETQIRGLNDQLAGVTRGLDQLKARPSDKYIEVAGPGTRTSFKKPEEIAETLKRRRKQILEQLKERTRARDSFKEQLSGRLAPLAEQVHRYDVGRGIFGQVKGRWDTMKFQKWVVKLPVELTQEAFNSIVYEGKAYNSLAGIPGIGSGRLIYHEIPIVGEAGDLLRSVFPGQAPEAVESLAKAGFIITKSDGSRVLKIPHLVKELIDIDDAATKSLHVPGARKHWNIPKKALRSFEKLLTRAARKGVALGDLHSGNVVVDKAGNAHVLDLGISGALDATDTGRLKAWRVNLAQFADFILGNTKYTDADAYRAARRIIDDAALTGRAPDADETRLLLQMLNKSGFPVRYLTEAGATKPLVEGFMKVKGKKQILKQTQRELVEERHLLIDELSPEAKQAYEYIRQWKEELTERLLATGLLTEEWIEAFEKKFNISHLRHLKTDEGLVRRFLRAVSSSITSPKKPGFQRARQIEGSLREIEERFGKQIFETDIAKIMFASEMEVTSAIENWKLLEKIRDNVDWSKPAMRVIRRVPIKKGKNKGKFRKVVDWVAEEGYEVVDHPVFKGKGQGWQVRSEIAEDIRGIIGKTREDFGHGLIKKWYDPVNNWMRLYSLFLFPTYHIRNFAGAIWNNFLADVDPKAHFLAHKVIWGGKKIGQWADEFAQGKPFEVDGIKSFSPNKRLPWKIDGKHMTYQEILDEANEMGSLGRGLMGAHQIDLGEHSLKSRMGSIVGAKQLIPGTRQWTPLQFGARVGNQVENVVRLAHYISKRKDGLSAFDAAMSVAKFQFDHAEQSPFMRNWLKRIFFFPTWTANNVPLQAKMFLLRPGKFTAVAHVTEAIERKAGPEPDDKLVPEWINKQFGVRFRYNKDKGTYEYFLLGGWLPAADIHKLFNPGDELINQIAPIPKQAVEQALNKSAFFDQELEEYPGQRREFLSPEAGQILAGIPGASALSKLLFGAPIEEGITVRGRTHNLMRQIRLINEIRRTSEAAARSGPGLALANTMVGKSYEFDPQRAMSYRDWTLKMTLGKLKRDLRKAMRAGKETEVVRLRRQIDEIQEELMR